VLSLDEYAARYAAVVAQFDTGDIRQELGTIIADGNAVAVQAESSLRLANGKIYLNHYHLYYEIERGRIRALKEYHDTGHFAECFDGRHPLLGQPVRASNLFDDVYQGEASVESDVALGQQTLSVVRDWLEVTRTAGSVDLQEMLTDDARVWFTGCPRVMDVARYVQRHDAFRFEVAGDVEHILGPVFAEESRASAQFASRAHLKNGKTYHNYHHCYFEIDEGRIAVLKDYMDSDHVTECFNGRHALLGQPPRDTQLI
jgi:hypothetical protein